MKTKCKFLIKQSLKKKMSTKWFKIANLLVLILLIGILNIDRIISYFGGDFEEITKIYVIDEAESYPLFENNFNTLKDSLEDLGNYELENSSKTIEELKEDVKDTDDIILTIRLSDTEYLTADVASFNPIGMMTEQLLQTSLNTIKSYYVLEKTGISESEIASLTSNVSLNKEVTNPDVEENAEGKDLVSSGLILILIVPFFILITMLTQMIGAEINDEKSTRSMEIIISNVSPKMHFASKIIASTCFVLVQAFILVVDVAIAFGIRLLCTKTFAISEDTSMAIMDALNMVKNTGILNLLLKGLPIMLILFLFSFVLYAIVAGVLASMTTNIEDYQQLQTPLMILLLVGYYVAIMASTFDGAIFIKILSYIPMLSFLIAPVIFLLGQTTILELGLSTLICIVFTFIIFHYGLRIYKVGILNYSSQDLWKKIFKSVKEK